MTSKEAHRNFVKDERGAVAATYALVLIPLIAVVGLGFDYARVMGMDTELQNAADQAALAGASQLDGTSGSMERAINAATGNLVTNSTILSNDGTGGTISITDTSTQIVFYETKADAEAGTGGFTDTSKFSDARFIQVTVDTRDANFAFTPLVGAVTGSLNAAAVAGMGSALCRVPPLMICNPEETSTNKTMDVAAHVGQGLLAKPGGGSGGWAPGNYGYLDVGLANGAVGVRQALGWGAIGNCISQNGAEAYQTDTQTGNIANAPEAMNTRFDVYDVNACQAGNPCPSAINVTKDFVRPLDSAPGSGKTCEVNTSQGGWRLPATAQSYFPADGTSNFTGTVLAMGHPRDKCHATYDGAPGNCKNSFFGNGIWDRDAYFRTHYKKADGSGWTNADWTAALATATLNSSTSVANITRYDVYKWEEEKRGTLQQGATVLDTVPPTATGSQLVSKGQAVCSAQHGYGAISNPDRRKMTIAVVNCNQQESKLRGKKPVTIAQWIDVFLVQAAADRKDGGKHYTGKDEIYVEIIKEVILKSSGETDGVTLRRDVPYLVR
ncbi:Von Willebrand factor type A domain protein, associated with Flp pilus assembly [Altererythrobacter epoxidivorans]|uniref:von Willebrand factor type A domain protein, associated with Flp pilus assembly n=1 Tax=Altererythrobacter epoxidivorans TaxID=361183 RepID=A0A0M5L0G8_9SPHN|nr:pilus assembly protein TadG-related protein [Altererythrobacter epoxidivorans]ALE16857.1 Von Willebrand factor type A domain protein, associated with Flp pilus assembly [Altererythrobacter epoxidivorans]